MAADGTPGRTMHYPLQINGDCSSLGESSYVPFSTPLAYSSIRLENEAGIFIGANASQIPENATAVRVNTTVAPISATGYVNVYPADQPTPPGVGEVVFNTKPVSTSWTVGLGDRDGMERGFEFYVGGEATVQVNIAGYFVDNSSGKGYTALDNGQRAYVSVYTSPYTTVSSGTINPTQNISGTATGIPTSGVSAVVASFSTYSFNRTSGYLLAGPTSNVSEQGFMMNVRQDEANSVQTTVPVAADGTLKFTFSASGTPVAQGHLIVDVFGWYSADGSDFHPVPEGARRLLSATTSTGGHINVPVGSLTGGSGVDGIPNEGVTAVDGALHVYPANGTAFNYLSVYPNGEPFTNATDVDYWDDSSTVTPEIHSVGVQAAVGRASNGASQPGFTLYNNVGADGVFFDATGYYCRPTPEVTSSSHPNTDQWYPAGGNFNVSWTVDDNPAVIAGYQVAYNTSPDFAFATVGTTQTANTFTTSDTTAGTHYLHVRAIGTTNVPSTTAHFRVQIAPSVGNRAAGSATNLGGATSTDPSAPPPQRASTSPTATSSCSRTTFPRFRPRVTSRSTCAAPTTHRTPSSPRSPTCCSASTSARAGPSTSPTSVASPASVSPVYLR